MKRLSWKIPRNTFLKGLGASLALPCLEIMGEEAEKEQESIKRACFVYFGNGVSLPPETNSAHKEWHWFPHETGMNYTLTQPLMPFKKLRDKISIVGGLHHPNATLTDIHVCSDMWMTGADLGGATYKNTMSTDQYIAEHFRGKTRLPFLALSCDGGVGFKSRIGTISTGRNGRAIPTENDPKRIFSRLFKKGNGSIDAQHKKLSYEAKVVDMVLDNARQLDKKLSKNDKEKMEQYLTSLSEVEDSIKRTSNWLGVPVKDVETGYLKLDADKSVKPSEYLDTMFNLISLAFEADITRVATFMMTREDGMGIADTFPTIEFGYGGHHALSHTVSEKDGYLRWAKYDQYLNQRLANFLSRIDSLKDLKGTVLDNTAVLYGSGCSSTHNYKNLPMVLAGGSNLGLKHGSHINYQDKLPANNMHYSILRAMSIPVKSYGDSNGVLKEIFT